MFQIDELLLEDIRTVYEGSRNRVVICRDRAAPLKNLYTCVSIHHTPTAKAVLSLLETDVRTIAGGHLPYRFAFTDGNQLVLAFEYREERRLYSFMDSQLVGAIDRERVCGSLVTACMSEMLPMPLLYLVLNKENLSIGADGQIYFNFFLQLDRINFEISQTHCVTRCAQIVLDILEGLPGKKLAHLKSYTIIRKKADRQAYFLFSELYKDIQLTRLPGEKVSALKRVKGWWARSHDRLFRALLWISLFCVILAVILLVTNFLFGGTGFPWTRNHALDIIGTESLG